MQILGIDPGTVNMGVGIIDAGVSGFRPVFYDVLKLSSKDSIPDRVGQIFAYISELIEQYKVDVLAIEDIFTSVNYKSALKLGHARGAVIAAVKNKDIPVYEYTPKAVKLSICGYGGADKEQVKRLTEMLLGIKVQGQYDITDALAIAVCHANHIKFSEVVNDRLS